MTARETSLLRLAQLRERQHDVASLHLRAARGNLAVAEAALSASQEHVRSARRRQIDAATVGNAEEWLLSCAEMEAGTLTVSAHHAVVAQAMFAVQLALQAEATARRERKQMEVTLEAVQRARAEKTSRAEQATLDEVARWKGTRLAGRKPLGF